jgi:hypothetical protein
MGKVRYAPSLIHATRLLFGVPTPSAKQNPPILAPTDSMDVVDRSVNQVCREYEPRVPVG